MLPFFSTSSSVTLSAGRAPSLRRLSMNMSAAMTQYPSSTRTPRLAYVAYVCVFLLNMVLAICPPSKLPCVWIISTDWISNLSVKLFATSEHLVNLPGVGVFPARFVYAESISSFPNFRSNFTAVVENPKRPSRSNSDTNTRFVASRDTASILDTALPSGKEPFIDAAVSASAMMRGMGFDFCSHSEHIATMVSRTAGVSCSTASSVPLLVSMAPSFSANFDPLIAPPRDVI